MKQRSFWDAYIHRTSQYIARHLYKPKVHCSAQYIPPVDLKPDKPGPHSDILSS
jgi:hypothetical protein